VSSPGSSGNGEPFVDAHDRLRQRLETAIPRLWRRRVDIGSRIQTRAAGETVTVALEDLGQSDTEAPPTVEYHPGSGTVGGLQTGEEWLAPPNSAPPRLRDDGNWQSTAILRETAATPGAVLPVRTGRISEAAESYRSALARARQVDTVTPLVEAIERGRGGIVAALLDVDPSAVGSPPSEEDSTFGIDPADDRPPAVRLLTSIVDTVPFAARDLALVCTAENGRRESEAYVVGTDDTPVGLFVHPVDGTDLDPTATPTRRDIESAMGFDRDAPTRRLDPDIDDRVRLQGDLRVRKTGAEAMALLSSYSEQVEDWRTRIDQIATAFLRRADPSIALSLDVSLQISRRHADPGFSVRGATISDRHLTPAQRERLLAAVVELLAAEDSVPVSLDDSLPGDASLSQTKLYRAVVTSPLADISDDIPPSALLVRPLDRSLVRSLLERAVVVAIEHYHEFVAAEMLADLSLSTVTLPLDNHLVVLDAGIVDSGRERTPVAVTVPRLSSLEVLHDEHETVTLDVAPGIYEFDFLPRSIETDPVLEEPRV
jgi:hypothetical protein